MKRRVGRERPPRRRIAIHAVEFHQAGRAGVQVVPLLEDPPRCGIPECSQPARGTFRGRHGRLEDRCSGHAPGRPIRELMLLYLEVVETAAVV